MCIFVENRLTGSKQISVLRIRNIIGRLLFYRYRTNNKKSLNERVMTYEINNISKKVKQKDQSTERF